MNSDTSKQPQHTTTAPPPPSRNWKVVLRAAPDELLFAEYRRRVAKASEAQAAKLAARSSTPPPPNAAATKKPGGRKSMPHQCPICQEIQPTRTLARRHDADCRRRNLLKPGARFEMMLNTQRITVELMKPYGKGWECVNVATGRSVHITSPRALIGFREASSFRGRQRLLVERTTELGPENQDQQDHREQHEAEPVV